MKNYLKRTTTFFLALLMLLSVPLQAFAEIDHDKIADYKDSYINKIDPVKPAKLGENQTATDLIKNPKQPAIYTLRTDYKVKKGEKYEIDYQPYIASVGEAATEDEQKKVNQTVKLPDLTGYEKPDDDYKIDYKTVKNAADGKGKTGNEVNGLRYSANQDFKYQAKSNQIKVKHVFQDLHDFSKYTNPDGTITQTDVFIKPDGTKEQSTKEEVEKHELITTQNGNTGSTMEVIPLKGNDVKGFVPEKEFITMQVPENAENFILEYRYNRAHYNVIYDTKGGTPLPSRTLYYGQEIPGIDKVPTKEGSNFLGWKPSVDLKNKNDRTFKADNIIKYKDEHGNAVNDLDIDLTMPAGNVTFTAEWKDKEKADYAIQFWAEKADHADDASLLEKYDYMGTHVYKDADTGSRPDLDTVPIDKIPFPDLDQARLQKIWNGDLFYGDKYPYINKFYVYNKDLTHDQNKDPKNVNLVKSVDSTGRTVYNIYYDRQVYDLYFTKSNALGDSETFYPSIYVPDGNGGAKLAGGPGNLYHYKARFNQLMLGWPNDAMQTKGFDEGKQSYGWGPNYGDPHWPVHLDTPPYRLNADEFLDMPNYENWGGYVNQIDKGDGSTINVKNDPRYKDEPYKALSFGIKQETGSMPHHMDFWMDGFKDGETIIRYDLYRSKADTNSLTYGHRYSRVQGFTPYGSTIEEGSEEHGRVTEDDINALNEEREGKTPYPDKEYTDIFGFNNQVGQMHFRPAFFNTADEFGDPLTDENEEPIVPAFKENGYIRFKYKRNKYPLRFNYDPSKIKGDNEFGPANSLDTFYEFPLKALSPDLVDNSTPQADREYFKDNPKNLLDNPENLQTLGLTDLVYTDKEGNLKVKRPEGLSEQMVFKGWALDPAGTKLIWENPKETMPTHALNLYAKWGEPDYKWNVTFDPDGGKLKPIKEENLTTERKKIQEGDIGQEEVNTYAKKEKGDGDKQVFTVIQRQKLVEPKFKPEKKGYDFMGWEVIRYKKDAKTGDYTDEIDNSYRETYKVPELYSFGNDVVSPIYLKAIWVPNERVDVDVLHYKFDNDYNLVEGPIKDTLEDKRAGYFVATTGDKQDDEYILAPHSELEEKLTGDLKKEYEDYNKRVGLNNSFFQTFRVEPAKILNKEGKEIDNPKAKNNVFKFFYRQFRKRKYKVNYIDEKFKGKETEKGAAIIDQELVENGNRHYDARNYRPIPGWVLTSDPQQQLFFDVNEDTNALIGINNTGKDEITFYYKDVRVIEVPKDDPVPDGYVRVTFKADKGGSFGKDAEGKDIKELNYDVIKGLKSDLLPVPQELKEGETKADDKYYITPDDGKKFVKWDEKPLLNKNTILDNDKENFYVFTAKFEWSGLSASGLVRTEAFKDPNGKWTNDFTPTIDDLKKQLVWKEKDKETELPEGTTIKFYDEAGKELTTNDQIYDLVNEKKAADKDELIRTVNIKVKATFKDGKEPQELVIPITVYKNVYEALNKEGDKPLFLTEAEGKKAEEGGLSDVTGNYVKVTVQPTEKNTNKDAKVYYVNPKAWVNIPEVEWSEADKDKYDFLKWTADKKEQNENKEENGIFDFGKRHKFTDKETLIKPLFTDDVVEQKEGKDKPKVPDTFVKVIVKTTDNATDETAFEKTFWVNPTKEVTIPVAEPRGKTDQEVDIPKLGKKKVNYVFNEWQKVKTGETDDSLSEVKPAVKIDLAKNKYTDKVTVIEASYFERFAATPIVKPIKTEELHTPEGKEITDKDLIDKITPPENKEIESITVVKRPDPSKPGKQEAKVIIKYKDGSTQGTDKDPVVIPVEVHKNIIPAGPNGEKPKEALENYKKVIFKVYTNENEADYKVEGGSLGGNLIYYVSPEVEVNLTDTAKNITKTPFTGYIVNGENWVNKDKKTLQGKFTDEVTEFAYKFAKSKDIVEKIDENTVIPKDYVKVTFKTENEAKGKIDVDKLEKIYYVNPTAGITLKVLKEGDTATNKQLAVPTPNPNDKFTFKEWQENIDENTPITSERIHVAIFESGQVTLTYEAGEGATGNVPTKTTVNVGATVGLAGPGNLAKENSTFEGWKLDGEDKIYKPGDQVKLDRARTATAQWKSSAYTVSFNTKGGSDVPSQPVEYGKTAIKPEAPTLDGKVFMGWKEKEADTSYFDFNTPITADKTLIAIWQDPVQKIGENDTVEEQFIKVTFNEGDHGKLKLADQEQTSPVTYKVAKELTFMQAFVEGKTLPEIIADKYFKAIKENGGWDKERKLNGQDIDFIAQYEPIADVIPIDPSVTPDNKLQEEKPDGMVLVTFSVDENKAFMVGDTKFYVKANTKVDIPTPVVHPRTLENDEPNDYEFKGWSYEKDAEGKYNFIFNEDTNINDGNLVKPIISLRNPRPNATIVYVAEITEGATAYIEVTRGSSSPVLIEAVNNDDGDIVFNIPGELGGKLKRRDKIRAYSKLNNLQSDIREYRVR